ncbi:hypothetical protein BKA65DRAFT_553656 [Rhexocercosporidium sp. MPI-PUGE-AT-0058]|nr:hypothetical protein BKA65DRAFT_553656 [Rhexocercosporidium sp. MPI-PUGE-AT-0058]
MDKSEYTDDELPSSTSFHPLKNEHTCVEERPSVENTTVTGSEDLKINPIGARGWRAPCSYDKPIELESDDRLEDDSNLDNGYTPRVVTSGKQRYDASNVDNIINGIKPPTLKRPRPNSISTFIPCQTRTLQLLHNEDEADIREFVCDSDPSESGADDIYSKRRKVSTPQGSRIISRNNLSQLSPPVSDDDEDSEEDDKTLSTSLDAILTSSSRSTPASEITSLIELEVCLVVTDVD